MKSGSGIRILFTAAGFGAILGLAMAGEEAAEPAAGEIQRTSAPIPGASERLSKAHPADRSKRASGRDLAALLIHIDSGDPDLRIRTRRLIRTIVHRYLRERTPEGMHLIPPNLTVANGMVCMEGGYYLGLHEVTVGQFRMQCADAERAVRATRNAPADAPITMVNLDEARLFAGRLGARLPTRDEIERAVGSGGRRRFPWGDRFDPARVNSREAGCGSAEPVGARASGCSAQGIHGLLGNVAEWTESTSGEGERQRYLVVGGSYRTPALTRRFVTYRMRCRERQPDVGFRIAKSLPPLPVAEAPVAEEGVAAPGPSKGG